MWLPMASQTMTKREREGGKEVPSKSMSCAQFYNEAVAQNTTLEIFYVLMIIKLWQAATLWVIGEECCFGFYKIARKRSDRRD